MPVIDFINTDCQMPDVVPDYEAERVHATVQSYNTKMNEVYGFAYVPYLPLNINEINITTEPREVISSRFSGCMMVAWEDSRGVFAAHVAIDEYNCTDEWEKIKERAVRSFSFKPSDFIPSPADANTPNCYGIIEFDQNFQIIAAYSIGVDLNNVVRQKVLVYKGRFEGKIDIVPDNK